MTAQLSNNSEPSSSTSSGKHNDPTMITLMSSIASSSSSSSAAAAAVAAASSGGGRVAIVTGANKGIGYYIALQLGMSGLFEHILLGCRDASRAQTAVNDMMTTISSSSSKEASKTKVSFLPLSVGDHNSHIEFTKHVNEMFHGKIDCLVNNAGFAYKNADPTPFQQQTKRTLNINFYGTIELTEMLLPLLRKGNDPRIVNVASMSGRLSQLSPELQQKFSSDDLTMDELRKLVDQFEADVQDGTHRQKGWSQSNYGLSKLAIIAATKVLARQESGGAGIIVNCCCPGYCKTDMTSQGGIRDPSDGARNAVIPATMNNPPTGEFFEDYKVSKW